jgi:signal recognition particle receptor subunit beta
VTTYKLLITGSVGAGKTTAITAISEIPPVCTDSPITLGPIVGAKTTTTVAMDYGEVWIDEEQKIGIFGTPGQRRYDFMCRILSEDALGVLVLLDQTSPEPLEELAYYLELYQDMVAANAAVIGVTHCEGDSSLDRYYEWTHERGLCLPVFTLDARDRSQVHLLLTTLLATAEVGFTGDDK